MAAMADDPPTARAICESSGLTPYQVTERGDACVCFDDRGNEYEVPLFIFLTPRHLDGEEPEDNILESGEEPECDGPPFNFITRLASGRDLPMEVSKRSSVATLKRKIAKQVEGDATTCKVILRGLLLSDQEVVSDRVKEGEIVQVAIRK